jgi:hypothetical protein
MLIKLLASETNLATATTVGGATVVRVLNTGSAASVTRKDSTPATIGSVTLGAGEVAYLEKDSSDTLEGGADFKVVKVAYAN